MTRKSTIFIIGKLWYTISAVTAVSCSRAFPVNLAANQRVTVRPPCVGLSNVAQPRKKREKLY